MTDNEYLKTVLSAQNLKDGSDELKSLEQHRKDVKALLESEFSSPLPNIRYGGSKAKGTLISELYDLDMICYFSHDDTQAGDSLEEIYNTVKNVLSETYHVVPKTSALRLQSKNKENFGVDFHIDVIPGRYTDETKTDCYLHQEKGDKERLKTNLAVHINHVKNSGVLDAIRLLKLWRVRRAIDTKQFIFELLCIELLKEKRDSPLEEQIKHVLEEVSGTENAIAIEDPANPAGNDLMPLLRSVWSELQNASNYTLTQLDEAGWEAIYGPISDSDKSSLATGLAAAAASVSNTTKPWALNE
ncbi:MAG: hypothetical protein WDZ75_00140 [Candidatus Paceibacterota bacterium]